MDRFQSLSDVVLALESVGVSCGLCSSQMLMSATIAVTTVIITAPTPLVASTAAAVKGLSSWMDTSVKVCYLDCLTTLCACVYSTCSTYVSFTVRTYIRTLYPLQ